MGDIQTIRKGNSSRVVPLFEPHLQALMGSAAVGLGYLGNDLRFLACNQLFTEILQLKAEKLIGQGFTKIFPEIQLFHNTNENNNHQGLELDTQLVREAGSGQRHVRVSLRPAIEANALVGFVVTAVDNTGYVRAREKLEAAQAALKAMATARETQVQREQALVWSGQERFLALLGHELRNPLTPILTWTQLLKQNPALDPQLSHAIAVIERNALHQKSLVDSLLDLASLQCGEMKLKQEPVELHALLAELLAGFAGKAKENQVTLNFEPAVPKVFVLGDKNRIAQFLGHLLGNALKFTGPGGLVKARLASANGWARVEIADNGIGIPKAFMGELFKTFTQAHELRSSNRCGLGLGLALVKQLVERHGGRVEAHSEGEHKGAVFTVNLPCWVQQSGEYDAAAAQPEELKRKVLIIEDNNDTREVLSTLLKGWGLVVKEAADGAQGLEVVSHFRPDLILCDLTMPVLDGWSVARQIRLREDLYDIPLVALTGHGTPEDIARCKEAGFQDHLVKPFEAHDLLRLLNKYLPVEQKE